MKFHWPFKGRSTGPNWADLSPKQKHTIARNVATAALQETAKHFGKGYEAVTFPFSTQRRPSYVETTGEDDQLTERQRHRLVNLQRDMMRNSPTRVAQDQQLRVNVVGHVGGKLYASFPKGYETAAEAVMNYFNREWAPGAEFSYRRSFNWLLKTALTAMDTNGNLILVFDDGILTGESGSGLIRGFEGDEIASVSANDFAALFPAKCRQSAGFVYNQSGQFTGAFVSTSQRGAEEFEHGKFLTLRRDPLSLTPQNWIAIGDQRRFNQGRAVSPLTAALTCLVDLHETLGSEAQAAKLNAQIVGQILEDESAELDSGGAFELDGADNTEREFTTRQLSSIGARFDKLPPGLKIELLDTKRPNANMPAYVEFLTGLVGGSRGMARVYSTLKAETSYTAFRGEQVMTWPSFEEAQKDLEREVCDWAAYHVINRAQRLGLITEELPEGWRHMIAWQWPRMREVSEKDAQAALQLKMRNGMTSLRRELGPGEVDRLITERAAEKQKFDDAGLIYPGEETASGKLKEEVVPASNNILETKEEPSNDE